MLTLCKCHAKKRFSWTDHNVYAAHLPGNDIIQTWESTFLFYFARRTCNTSNQLYSFLPGKDIVAFWSSV